jgi:hypothetical protein
MAVCVIDLKINTNKDNNLVQGGSIHLRGGIKLSAAVPASDMRQDSLIRFGFIARQKRDE